MTQLSPKKHSSNKTVTSCLLFGVLAILSGFTRPALALQPGTQQSVTRIVQYGFTIRNKTGIKLNVAEFWTYAPVKRTSSQQCTNISVSHPYQLIEDTFGNQILHFTFIDLPPYTTKIITIRATLTMTDSPIPAGKEKLDGFLKSEKYVESDHLEIIKKAKALQGKTPLQTAQNSYFWVSKNIEYTGYSSSERGALYALKYKKGDCTEFMDLFTALARSSEIPVRRVAGYVKSENGIVYPMEFHNWAEFLYKGVWRIADPQKKAFMNNQTDYIATRIIGPTEGNPMGDFNRFRVKGYGLAVKMNN